MLRLQGSQVGEKITFTEKLWARTFLFLPPLTTSFERCARRVESQPKIMIFEKMSDQIPQQLLTDLKLDLDEEELHTLYF